MHLKCYTAQSFSDSQILLVEAASITAKNQILQSFEVFLRLPRNYPGKLPIFLNRMMFEEHV